MPTMTRLIGSTALAFVLSICATGNPDAGDVPDVQRPPEDWVKISALASTDVIQFVQALPHDPYLLGPVAAHVRTKAYGPGFSAARISSLDGTPLAGRITGSALKPRPGVVLVHGFRQTKDRKFVVELAELFARNGWRVLAIDLRGHGESRNFSSAPITGGWKEAEDILAAARHLKDRGDVTSVSVVGFSMGGQSLVKAMAQDGGQLITAGIAVAAPLAAPSPLTPPAPGYVPGPGSIDRLFLDFLGASSFYEYYERSARFYGVDLRTLESRMPADSVIGRVKAPLLMLYTLDDFLWHRQLKLGRHDGGSYSLAYLDLVRDHLYVKTLLLDRGGHGGLLYLSDPHWFGLGVMSYLKHWQARDLEHVTVAVPPVDILAEGTLSGETVTYRLLVRNHGPAAAGPLTLSLDVPPGARLGTCWVGMEGLGRCAREGDRLVWILPRVSGGKTMAGPFVAVVDVSGLKAKSLPAAASVEPAAAVVQDLTLQKE